MTILKAEVLDDFIQLEKTIKSHLSSSEKALIGINKEKLSFGSGVIVDKTGIFLTAAHVMKDRNTTYNILFSDGKIKSGKCLGYCEALDCAVGAIIEEGIYPTVPLAKKTPQKGDWVYALGHPYEYNPEKGIVLRLGKLIDQTPKLYQTDCKIVSGDSGGALFNQDGELIAIHSRIGQSLEDNVHIPLTIYLKNWQALLKPQEYSEQDLLSPSKQ